jgi:hypothetical protein
MTSDSMTQPASPFRHAQVWVELKSADPEARSAFAVARARLAAGRKLSALRRFRVFELEGPLPDRERIAELLHHSTQFYNPHKENCVVRISAHEPAPVAAGDQLVLVTERGGERRPAAERWWHQECGDRVRVCEGLAWVLSFDTGEPGAERSRELAETVRRDRGLLSNPNSQDAKLSGPAVPMPWIHEI